jgi:hypothetical protein
MDASAFVYNRGGACPLVADLVGQSLELPEESFDALNGNVALISDSGLTPAERRRIRAAMRLLRTR